MTIDRLCTVPRPRRRRARLVQPGVLLAGAISLSLLGASYARADKIKNGTAVFSGLDKITGRIIGFKAGMGETVQFGSLKVTARVCYTRPATETPQTDTFVEVDEVSAGKDDKRIFSGWMYASSPGLHGIEHPVYDIWLTDCKDPGDTIADAPQTADAEDPNAVPPVAGAVPSTPPPNPSAAPADASARVAPAPRPKRVARPAPAPAPVIERREPTQRFFPDSQYPTDAAGPSNPVGSHAR